MFFALITLYIKHPSIYQPFREILTLSSEIIYLALQLRAQRNTNRTTDSIRVVINDN